MLEVGSDRELGCVRSIAYRAADTQCDVVRRHLPIPIDRLDRVLLPAGKLRWLAFAAEGGVTGRAAAGGSRDAGGVSAEPGQAGATVDVAQLVRGAANGDRAAWERLVDQYSRLIWAMTRDFRLAESDAADVVQATWLRLLEHIDRIEYPARIGSWLATTARHECLRHLAASKKVMLVQDEDLTFGGVAAHQPELDERLLADERAQAVRAAMSTLPARSQRMLELLMADPPVSYTEISDQLGVPIGSIGPTRGRCLESLRLMLQTV